MASSASHCASISSTGSTGRHPTFAAYEADKRGTSMSPRYVKASLARLGERAGIDKRVHPHGLRLAVALDLAQQGVPVHHIQAQLSHSTLPIMDR